MEKTHRTKPGRQPGMMLLAAGWLLIWGAWSGLHGQSLSVSPASAEMRLVQGWAVAPALTFAVEAPGSWTAAVEGANWLALTAVSGSGAATVRTRLVYWAAPRLAPGTYTARVVFTPSAGQPVTAVITCTVAPAAPRPRYSYLNGPHHCVQPDGYESAATCTVPGEKPPGDFRPPPPGGSYLDPNFGALLRIVTEPNWLHSYSSPSALSAGNKHALVMRSGGWNVVQPLTARVVRERVPAVEGSVWDAADPDVFYSIRGTRIERYDLRSGSTRVLVDYANATPRLTRITNGGAGDASKDNWLSFYAPEERLVCAVNLQDAKTYCGGYENLGRVALDPTNRGTLIAKGIDGVTRKRYVLLIAHPTLAVFSVNVDAGRLDFENLAPERLDGIGNGDGICEPGETCYKGEHADTMEDAEGNQYVVGSLESSGPCRNGIYSFRLNAGSRMLLPAEVGGGARRLTTLQNCGGADPWTDWHLSCAKLAPYCAVSTTYSAFRVVRDPNDLTPIRRTAHLSEVMIIKDNGAEIRRLAQHRSVQFSSEEARGYWSTPRASISFDGSYVVFDSNFGEPNRQRVVMAETGYGTTRINAVRDAAAFGVRLSPGSIASIFGENLAHCNRAAEEYPLPDEICGTSVRFGEAQAPLLFASTSQVNVVVPAALPPLTAHSLRVARGAEPEARDTWTLDASSVVRHAPAIFSYVLEDGLPRALVHNVDAASGRLTLNGPAAIAPAAEPQTPGQAGVIYAGGLGPVDPPVPDGVAAPAAPLSRTAAPVEVLVNGAPQQVLFAGLAPAFAGLFQVNYLLSESTPLLPPEQNRIWLRMGDAQSEPLTISLSPRR